MSALLKRLNKEAKKQNKKDAKPQQKSKAQSKPSQEEQDTVLQLIDTKDDQKAPHKEAKIKLNSQDNVLNDDGMLLSVDKFKRDQVKVVRTTWETSCERKVVKKFDLQKEKQHFIPLSQDFDPEQAKKQLKEKERERQREKDTPVTVFPKRAIQLTKQQEKELEMERKLQEGRPAVTPSTNTTSSSDSKKIQFGESFQMKKNAGGSSGLTRSLAAQKQAQIQRKLQQKGLTGAAKGTSAQSYGLTRASKAAQPTKIQFQQQFKFVKRAEKTSTTAGKSAQQLKEQQAQRKLNEINSPIKKPAQVKTASK